MIYLKNFKNFLNEEESTGNFTFFNFVKKVFNENPLKKFLVDTVTREEIWNGWAVDWGNMRINPINPDKLKNGWVVFDTIGGKEAQQRKFIEWWNKEIVPYYNNLSAAEKEIMKAEGEDWVLQSLMNYPGCEVYLKDLAKRKY
jgi:hypothetical protein